MKNSKIVFRLLKNIRLSTILITSILGTTAYAEHVLVSPTEVKIKVKYGQITSVLPGGQQIINGTDKIMINKLEATFECKATSERINPEVRLFAFGFSPITSPISEGSNTGKITIKAPLVPQEFFDSKDVIDECKEAPDGEVVMRHLSMPFPLYAACTADIPRKWWAIFVHSDMDDLWNVKNNGAVRVNIECDNTLISTKEPRKRSDGDYMHCCKAGWSIANMQRTCVTTNSDKSQLCSKMIRPSEQINEPKDEQSKTTYSYVCPTDMYLSGKDINYDVSYERRTDDEKWCYRTPASGRGRG